ncbi:MAG: Flp pilus assembly protein CpaB [Bdellovibrionales bacterium]|nr:Flp pilus assembly protein CpaB [Bdellovibrionales bacterium]
MTTRFGHQSPFQTYVAKVRWVVGSLLTVIVMLAISTVYIAAQAPNEADAVQAFVSDSDTMSAREAYVTVLSAQRRIEIGEELSPTTLVPVSLRTGEVPVDAVRVGSDILQSRRFASRLLHAGDILTYDVLQEHRPPQLFIPDGFRAVTLKADERELVDGYVTPSSRVDVLWRHTDVRGMARVKPVVKFAKVLSVNGKLEQGGRSNVGKQPTTVTLLVTAREAQLLELARSLGTLSLVLLGNGDNGALARDAEYVTAADLFDSDEVSSKEVPFEGVAYTADPANGKALRYVLRGRRWSLDTQF